MSQAHAVHSISSLDTDIVVDLGCCGYERNGRMEDSIFTLIKRFKPAVLFGFDPHPALKEGVGQVHGTTVITSRRAAWLFDGNIRLEVQGNCTHVVGDLDVGGGPEAAQAFDIVAWMRSLPAAKIVLKLDIEGAEYVLLPYLIQAGLIDQFSLVLVEWHTGELANGYESDRESILKQIPCPTEDWQ
jgi:hypothetical protein